LLSLMVIACGGEVVESTELSQPQHHENAAVDQRTRRIQPASEITAKEAPTDLIDSAELYADQVCGKKRCPAASPCSARAYGTIVLCMCEYQGYRLLCR